MLNDKKASELISRSLHGVLPEGDTQHLEQNLAESQESQSFAKLSEVIQKSVAGIAESSETGDASIAPGLSAAAKERLRESVQIAQRRSLRLTGASAASDEQGVDSSDTETRRATGAPIDARRASLRFTLIRKIGEGGLGTVWLARDEALKRTVAIKEMNAAAAESPKLWSRFQREAQITGHLEHPGIVPLYMFGTNVETGHPFCAMRFLGKQTLADAILAYHAQRKAGHEDNIQLHRLLNAFLDVCQTIAYAHSRGVVHRDLKPENIALDRFGQVIVLDWGLAKLTSDGELSMQLALSPRVEDSSVLAQSMAGDVIGTPLYMAPEQAAGHLDRVDERTDVYGLGAILFSILTGAAPHEKSNVGQDGVVRVPDLLKTIAENETPRPRAFNPHVPQELENICHRAMARERFARHTSALELANHVEKWMAGQNEQGQIYEALRREGNELRSSLTAAIRDLGAVARFVSILPPIQELIDVENSEDHEGPAKWCGRLAKICNGLLRTKPSLNAITYSRVTEETKRELVRVERHSADPSSIRSIPRSRLVHGALDAFGAAVLSQKPEEVFVDLVSGDDGEAVLAAQDHQLLVAGVPIFDSRTEEVSGLVSVEVDFTRLVEAEIRAQSQSAEEVFIVNDHGVVLKHQGGNVNTTADGNPASQVFSDWSNMHAELSARNEYVDASRTVYAIRIALVPRVSCFTIILVAKTAT